MTVNDVRDGMWRLTWSVGSDQSLTATFRICRWAAQVASFTTTHLGYPISSPPAIMEKRPECVPWQAVDRFATANETPGWCGSRTNNTARSRVMGRGTGPVRAKTGRAGVAAIGVAQEFAPDSLATKAHRGHHGAGWLSFTKAQRRRVTCYYFYVWDYDSGRHRSRCAPISPYPMKIWLNGHEWLNRQAATRGIGFAELSNGFAMGTDPAALQAICDRLGPGTIRVFVERWWSILPLPLTETTAPRAIGGAVDAPAGDLTHPGVRPTPPCPRVLRGPGGRQPRHRPPGADRAGLPAGQRRDARPPGSSRPRSSPTAPRSTLTPSTGTPASSNI